MGQVCFKVRKIEVSLKDSMILKESLSRLRYSLCPKLSALMSEDPSLGFTSYCPRPLDEMYREEPIPHQIWPYQPSPEVAHSIGPVGLPAYVIFLKVEKPSCL